MRELLSQKDVQLEDRDFFKDPFSEKELRELARKRSVAEVFSSKSPSVKAMGLEGQKLSDDEMVKLMLQEPRLIRRPLVVVDGELIVGGSPKELEKALG